MKGQLTLLAQYCYLLEEFMTLNEICSFLFIFSLVVEDPVEKWVISTQQQQLQTQ